MAEKGRASSDCSQRKFVLNDLDHGSFSDIGGWSGDECS